MSGERPKPSAAVVAKIRAASERTLAPEEVEAVLRTPISEAEREETLALVSWFRRRYPTPAERLAYVRRAYRRWQTTAGVAR